MGKNLEIWVFWQNIFTYYQDIWGISACVYNYFGLFATHSFTNFRPGLFTYLLTRVDALKDLVWSNIQPFQAGIAKVKSLRYPYLKIIFCSVVDPALCVLANARL